MFAYILELLLTIKSGYLFRYLFLQYFPKVKVMVYALHDNSFTFST